MASILYTMGQYIYLLFLNAVHKIQHYTIHTLPTNETVRLTTLIDRSQGRQNYELFDRTIIIIWCGIPLTN
jgi:hypothetical protein